ncbi:MAG: hypothetical protein D6798_09190 [Deltaproteobacteria bacterium]|nr:MAG: hypothetical protein D6798_09190 [Deltaproteobacteria bacterium]
MRAPGDVLALVIPVGHAGATVVAFTDRDGHPVDLDLDAIARHMSVGGHAVGVAHGDVDAPDRRWNSYDGGEPGASFGPADEPWLPGDEDGFPDLDGPRVREADGIPEGHVRFRTCHDLGMTQTFSCRFGPVRQAIERVVAGEDLGQEAFMMVLDGKPLSHPVRAPWPAARPS